MEIRKLVKSGNLSFTVAMPKAWVDKNKLKKGDVIYINENLDNTLTVSKDTKSLQENTNVIIQVDGKKNDLVLRELRAAYLAGANEIILKFPKDRKDLAESIRIIKKSFVEFSALEIIDETEYSLTLRIFVDYNELFLEKLTRRVDNMVRSMLLDSMQCFNKQELAKDIYERDYEVNKVVFLIFRVIIACLKNPDIAKRNSIKPWEAIKYWHIVFIVEEIGDIAKRIAKIIAEPSAAKKIDKQFVESHYKRCIDIYCENMESFYKKDVVKGVEIKEKIIAMQEEYNKHYLEKSDFTSIQITGRFKQFLSKIKDMTRIEGYLE